MQLIKIKHFLLLSPEIYHELFIKSIKSSASECLQPIKPITRVNGSDLP